MNTQKKDYEEVFSSDFSEAKEYDSSDENTLSSDESSSSFEEFDKVTKKITRDFWVKKEAAEGGLSKKTGRKKVAEGDTKKSAVEKELAEEARERLTPLEFLRCLSKTKATRSKVRGGFLDVAEKVEKLLKARPADSAGCYALGETFLLDSMIEAFKKAKNETELKKAWDFALKNGELCFDFVDANLSIIEKDLKNLKFKLDSEIEKNRDIEKKYSAVLNRFSLENLLKSIGFFLESLSFRFDEFCAISTSLEHLEKCSAEKSNLINLLKKAKKISETALHKESLLNTTLLLIERLFEEKTPNIPEMGLNAEFSQKEFSANKMTHLALFVLKESPLQTQKIRAAIRLSSHLSANNHFYAAKAILSQISNALKNESAAVPPTERKPLKVVFNRAQAKLALCAFSRGLFDESAASLSRLWGQGLGCLSLLKASSDEEFEQVEAAFYFSVLFFEAERQAALSRGEISPPLSAEFLRARRIHSASLLGTQTESTRRCALNCLRRLEKADWRGFAEELRTTRWNSLFGVEQEKVLFGLLEARARECALRVFLLRFGNSKLQNATPRLLGERFGLSEEKAAEVVGSLGDRLAAFRVVGGLALLESVREVAARLPTEETA